MVLNSTNKHKVVFTKKKSYSKAVILTQAKWLSFIGKEECYSINIQWLCILKHAEIATCKSSSALNLYSVPQGESTGLSASPLVRRQTGRESMVQQRIDLENINQGGRLNITFILARVQTKSQVHCNLSFEYYGRSLGAKAVNQTDRTWQCWVFGVF